MVRHGNIITHCEPDFPSDSADMDDPITVGLQEWSVCCKFLLGGEIILMLRKGGIHERHGGLFTLEHTRFALLPTFLHQQEHRLAPKYAGMTIPWNQAPGRIPVEGYAEVVRIWKCEDLAKIIALGDELLWNEAEIASRFNYRSQPWLFVVAVRAFRLPAAQLIEDHPSYAGCRSWIPLREPIDASGGKPSLSAAELSRRIARIEALLG